MIREDCFAWSPKKNYCLVLDCTLCQHTSCSFYKTKKQAVKDYFATLPHPMPREEKANYVWFIRMWNEVKEEEKANGREVTRPSDL